MKQLDKQALREKKIKVFAVICGAVKFISAFAFFCFTFLKNITAMLVVLLVLFVVKIVAGYVNYYEKYLVGELDKEDLWKTCLVYTVFLVFLFFFLVFFVMAGWIFEGNGSTL